jgi:type II secretory pathway pseudopilin PulG
MNYRGYTLIEVMIAICLLMLIVGLTVGNISYSNGMLAHAELHKMYSVCSYLQMRARATGQSQVVAFDSTHNTYSYNGITELLPTHVVFGALDGVKGPPSSPKHCITKPITSENQCITFTPHGIIQPGTIYIKTTDNMRMYALSSSVAQASFLRMYEYHQGAWRVLT